MTLQTISPAEARRMSEAGARLIDIRSPDEFARAHVPGAQNRPVDTIEPVEGAEPVIFLCRSGMRTSANAAKLSGCCTQGYLLEGGLDGWRQAGLPVEEDRKAPLEIMRQVQITAGSLVVIGVLLGFLASPVWFGLSAFVGAGLVFAGATGWCGMANLLGLMPWNRRTA